MTPVSRVSFEPTASHVFAVSLSDLRLVCVANKALRAVAHVAIFVACAAVAGCAGDGPPAPPDESNVVGRISAARVEGGVELSIDALVRPIRSLQVDIKLEGANALAARSLSGNDVLEAGLNAPRDDLTVVLSDTRRIALAPGAVVRLETDRAPASIALSRALAVDSDGSRATLAVGAP